MKTGDIVRDSPLDVIVSGWLYSKRSYPVETGIVEDSAVGDETYAVRWLYSADGTSYCCYHQPDELSLYCPKEKLF